MFISVYDYVGPKGELMKWGITVIWLMAFTIWLSPTTAEAKKASTHGPSPYRLAISMAQHRLTVYKYGSVIRTIHISGGGEYWYTYRDKRGRKHRAKAHTPRGNFAIYRRQRGRRVSHLGSLYNPLYFTGGYAIHGSYSVPRRHVSHGCIRAAMRTSRWLRNIPLGTPVQVS